MISFCSHPSHGPPSNSGLALRQPGAKEFTAQAWEMSPAARPGDVAATRITGRMAVPRKPICRRTARAHLFLRRLRRVSASAG
ncbi:MAG: hypothetical protein R2911_09535 [Caldilineaceae bacterium]